MNLSLANKALLNKKIVQIRYMTDQEQQAFNWRSKSIIFQMDDGTLVFPSTDEDGTDAGVLHLMKDEQIFCIPTL